jgi:putative ABC transport system permease protein
MGWWHFFSKQAQREPRIDSELRFHIDALTEANIAAGMSPAEARRQAQLEFGGREQIKEELRDVYRVRLVDATIANFKSAFRFLRKSPSFSIAVILTLALGIGANSAVFSAIDAILLKPLPFPNGDELMTISQFDPKVQNPISFVAPIRLEDWNRMNATFQAITGYFVDDATETSGALPEKVTLAYVAPRFLQVWGVSPAIGRDFAPDEIQLGGPPAVLISDRYWRQKFGADNGVLGKKIRIGSSASEIVGVMPASFRFPVQSADVWSPVQMGAPYTLERADTWYNVVGRLKADTSVAQAQSNLATVQAQLGHSYPKTDARLAVNVQPLKETTVGSSRRSLWILFGAVTLLLVIACTNIVALLLARAAQRQHEISVRVSLGGSRGTIIAQLLTEAFVLALAGATLGLLVAQGGAGVFRSLAADLPRVDEIRLDWRIVLYSLACSVFVTLACGLFPAIRGTRSAISGALAQASRTQVSGRNRLQWLLVGVQVALAVTLLAGAGLLLRSLQALGRVSPGFDSSRILTLHVSGSWGETADMQRLTQRIDRTIETLAATPGVESAATSATLPGVPGKYQTELRFQEGESDPQHKILADSHFVSPAYFATMKIPLLGGESCREEPKTPNILVNRSFAEMYLSGSSPVGRHLELASGQFVQSGEIRGVVGDARELGLNKEPEPIIYWCVNAPMPDPYYLVRTNNADPMTMARTLREILHEFDPGRSVFDISPLDQHLDDAFSENRLRTVLLAFFAATAVALACVGLYGTLTYSLSLRRREVGLRLALGANRSEILKRFLMEGLGVSLLGCLAGAGLAVAFARMLSGMLYGVSPSDPLTLAAVIAVVLIVAAAASLIPAVRAARVEPMQVLREE